MKKTAWLTLFFLFAAHILLLFLPPLALDSYFSLFRPTVYVVAAALFAVFLSGRERVFPISGSISLICLLGAVLLAGSLFGLGLIFGFAQNPLSADPAVLLKNTWMFIFMAIVREYLRGKILTALGGRPAVIAAVTLVFSLCFIDNLRLVGSYSTVQLINFFPDTLLPTIALNFFLTYTAQFDTGVGAMVFMGLYRCIYYASPALPGIPKILDAMVICLCVFVIYILFDGTRLHPQQREGPYPWRRLLFTTAAGALLIMFTLGVFRYFPLVVLSASMETTFSRGDVVIIRKLDTVSAAALDLGDVVEYRSEAGIPIVHRIVEIMGNADGRIYITKGDNNPVPDENPVLPEQIVGEMVFSVPYAGYPTLLLTMR